MEESRLEDVIVSPSISATAYDKAAEAKALLALSETLAHAPEHAWQKLVDTAMQLTQSESAGLSVESHEAGERVLRWTATAGKFERYLHGTMPRDFSPCGTAMDRRMALIMRKPARYYPYIAQLHVEVRCALLVPFVRRGEFVGTLWTIIHSSDRVYSSEDKRIVEALSTFATAVLDSRRRTG